MENHEGNTILIDPIMKVRKSRMGKGKKKRRWEIAAYNQ
jgi:hypothetical protein